MTEIPGNGIDDDCDPATPAPLAYDPTLTFTNVAGGVADSGYLDGDNYVDVVIGGYARVFYGDGTGKLTPATSELYHWANGGIAVTDMNLDGLDDVVTAGNCGVSSDFRVSVLLQKDDHTFATATTSSNLFSQIKLEAVRDLNGDGYPDSIVSADDFRVIFNDGTGAFPGSGTSYSASNMYRPAVGNFDKGAPLDLAWVSSDTGLTNIRLRAGTVSGTFGSTTFASALGPYPTEVAASDITGDGLTDLMILVEDKAYPFKATADGKFTRLSWSGYDLPGYCSQPLVFGDWTHDGDIDFACAVAGGGSVILAGNGAGGFRATISMPIECEIVLGVDLNSDGLTDAVCRDGSTGYVLLGVAE